MLAGSGEATEAWRAYFTVDRVMQVRDAFNRAIDGWAIDAEQTYKDFSMESRNKSCRRRAMPYLTCRPEPSKPASGVREAQLTRDVATVDGKRETRSEKKSKKKRDRLPPAIVVPAPKKRRDSTAAVHEPDVVQREASEVKLCDPDVFVPILVVTGRPATQLHYAKLTRFVRSLRDVGKAVPFLLRNIAVEPEAEGT